MSNCILVNRFEEIASETGCLSFQKALSKTQRNNFLRIAIVPFWGTFLVALMTPQHTGFIPIVGLCISTLVFIHSCRIKAPFATHLEIFKLDTSGLISFEHNCDDYWLKVENKDISHMGEQKLLVVGYLTVSGQYRVDKLIQEGKEFFVQSSGKLSTMPGSWTYADALGRA